MCMDPYWYMIILLSTDKTAKSELNKAILHIFVL